MIYFQLFLSFLQVGMFSIGGGYAAIPLIQSETVNSHQWLTLKEFTDLITIAEMTPGPIAVNAATFVGIKIAGYPGAIIATLGCIFPSCFIVSFLYFVYYRYKKLKVFQSIMFSLRPVIVALIAAAGISILRMAVFDDRTIRVSNISWQGLLTFLAAFLLLRKWKWNPILVMVLCGLTSLLVYILPFA